MKRLLIAICLLAASGVLAQTSGTLTHQPNHQTLEQQCNSQVNNCGFLTLDGPTSRKIIPSPVWVADPSAGHYDCPDGWTAYNRSEPEVYRVAVSVPAIYRAPNLDKKGHVLNDQPPAPICIQEKP